MASHDAYPTAGKVVCVVWCQNHSTVNTKLACR